MSRTWAARVVGLMCGLCVTLVLVEAGYRAYQAIRYHTPPWYAVDELGRDPNVENRLDPIALDPRLGWRAASNYRYDGPRRNLDGSSYTVHVSFGPNGFRLFGDPSSTGRRRILVIGDSYTQAVQVS